jgi:hypothetical protein
MRRQYRIDVLVPVDLLEAARRAAGRAAPEGESVSASDLVRHALAELAGVDPAEYPVPRGRPRKDRAVAA